MSKKQKALNLAKSLDKGVKRGKLSDGRGGEQLQAHSGVFNDCSYLRLLSLSKTILFSLEPQLGALSALTK